MPKVTITAEYNETPSEPDVVLALMGLGMYEVDMQLEESED